MAQKTEAREDDTSDDEDYPVVAAAFQPRDGGKVYVHRGPNQTEYPVKFDRVDGDGCLSVDSVANRLTKRLVGIQFFVAKKGTEAADELEALFEDIQETNDPLDEVLDRRLEELPESLCE